MSSAAPAAGIASALAWGAGDFAGGMAARKQNVFVVVFLSQVIGLALLLTLAAFVREPLPPAADFGWGAAAGVSGAVGVTALYASLSMGRMGIAAPITGVVAALIPVAYAWIFVGGPSSFGYAGMGLAVAGIVLVSAPKAERPPSKVLGLALLSGLGFAGFLLLMGLSSGSAFLWTLIGARAGSALVTLIFAASRPRPWGRPTWAVLGASMGDTLGNAFFLLAARLGRLDAAVVLSSLYPIATVLMARMILRERLTWMQTAGAALMILAIPLVAMA